MLQHGTLLLHRISAGPQLTVGPSVWADTCNARILLHFMRPLMCARVWVTMSVDKGIGANKQMIFNLLSPEYPVAGSLLLFRVAAEIMKFIW